ncbi:uncharacterized protein LOC129918324 isoform X2 [Episyrphus balteatus]|uniref:uncharacterized protein LOC129918324 isoform X2 n=1 Tax=Episyrphus balteatus TaxID=286459 RepID=UPI0024864EFF|nr:uncharacterized protein LOC129918324 isoform X2 [Episyrphus balteatus]
MPFGRKSPLEALALPGVILAYKYSQFRQRRREAASRRVTERELSALHHKIDKLLSKLEESEPEPPTSQEDECVICINARATMQTSPCGHRVVCRRCFVKTIQSAVAQRLLPLRCVICRARVNRLTSSSGTWRIQESASSYSMGAKSWSSTSGCMPPSASSYSMGDAHSGHHQFHAHSVQHNRVAQSASLYSMSSGTSSISSGSNLTSCSKTSSASSGVDSSLSSASSASNRHYLAPPPVSGGGGKPHHNHNHATCPSGCSGAIPRKPLSSSSSSSSASPTPNGGGTINTYPGRRLGKGRLADLQNRLPPIKEFRSPAKVPHPSPVHISNPRFRYSSYTKSATNHHEMVPLLAKDPSPPRRASTATMLLSKQSSATSSLGLSAKISPITSKNSVPKNGFMMTTQAQSTKNSKYTNGSLKTIETTKMDAKNVGSGSGGGKKFDLNSNSSSSSKTFPLFSNKLISNQHNNNSNNNKEKADNKKNESVERKKKEEKLKIKAEKEARKEEKRLAKEEERMAKLIAKEEKKKGKKEVKELLLANDGNNKKL